MVSRTGQLIRSNAIAFLAVFVALGGTAYSALRVTGKQVVNGSLTGRDVRDGSIRRVDLNSGVFAVTPTPTATATATAGATPSPTATPVPSGPYTKIVTRFSTGAATDNEVTGDFADCKTGEVATGGGVMNNSPSGNGSTNVPMVITNSYPAVFQTGREAGDWQGTVKYEREFAGQPLRRPIVYVICASR